MTFENTQLVINRFDRLFFDEKEDCMDEISIFISLILNRSLLQNNDTLNP